MNWLITYSPQLLGIALTFTACVGLLLAADKFVDGE